MRSCIPASGRCATTSGRSAWDPGDERASDRLAAPPAHVPRTGRAPCGGPAAASGFGPVVLRHTDAIAVYCYSLSNRDDAMTDLFRARAAGWRDCVDSTPIDLVDLIRADAIDLLVDLSGFSAGNSLQTFCYKPAPVQITAWGYATGTGCKIFDAFFADAYTVPPHLERYYTEPVMRLPSIVPYMGPGYAPGPAIRDPGAPFTFGSFSRPEKGTLPTLALWGDVL